MDQTLQRRVQETGVSLVLKSRSDASLRGPGNGLVDSGEGGGAGGAVDGGEGTGGAGDGGGGVGVGGGGGGRGGGGRTAVDAGRDLFGSAVGGEGVRGALRWERKRKEC